MTAMFLRPTTFTVVSATNVSSSTFRDNINKDILGLDTRFTGDTVIVLDRGSNPSPMDTVAFINTTLSPKATIKVEAAAASTFSTILYTLAAQQVPIIDVQAPRSGYFHVSLSDIAHRYVRLTVANTLGSFDLGRVVMGKAITTTGVNSDAERLIDDRSEAFEFGAYTVFDEAPVLLGWKVGLPFMDEVFYRQTWQPFMQSVGNNKCFLFLPLVEEQNTWQADWCYGRIVAKASTKHVGHDAWVQELTMRGIYP